MTDTAQDLLFDLTLTDDQRMNRDTMQRFAAAEIRERARAVDAGDSQAMDFYPATAELGLALLPIPEALGGAGMERSPVSNALIMEDLSHGDMAIALGAVAPLRRTRVVNHATRSSSALRSPSRRPMACDRSPACMRRGVSSEASGRPSG